MAAKSSTVYPMRLTGVILSLVPYGALVGLFRLGGLESMNALLAGTFTFLVYRLFIVRRIITRDHRRGVVAVRAGRFEDGLRAFEASERAFERRPTLDRFRALIMGSATPHTFRVLAIYNQGYALSRLGRGEEALARLGDAIEADPSMMQAHELRDVLLAGSQLHPEVGEAMAPEPEPPT